MKTSEAIVSLSERLVGFAIEAGAFQSASPGYAGYETKQRAEAMIKRHLHGIRVLAVRLERQVVSEIETLEENQELKLELDACLSTMDQSIYQFGVAQTRNERLEAALRGLVEKSSEAKEYLYPNILTKYSSIHDWDLAINKARVLLADALTRAESALEKE